MKSKFQILLAVLVLFASMLACNSVAPAATEVPYASEEPFVIDEPFVTEAPFATEDPGNTSLSANISNIRMAKDSEASDITTTFYPNDVIYVFFDVEGVDVGANFDIKWYALSITGQDPGTPIMTSEYVYNNEVTLYAQIESTTGGLPVGDYKVEIYMNGSYVGEQLFNIE